MGRKLDAMRAAVGAKPTPAKKEPGPDALSIHPTPVDTGEPEPARLVVGTPVRLISNLPDGCAPKDSLGIVADVSGRMIGVELANGAGRIVGGRGDFVVAEAVPLINLPPPKPAKKEKRDTSNVPRLPDGSRFEMIFTSTGPGQGHWDGTLTVPHPLGGKPVVIAYRKGGIHLMHARLSDRYWRYVRDNREMEEMEEKGAAAESEPV